jgi:hypothetical protein
MSISAKNVRFDESIMWVELVDGRVLGVPLAWFPKLLHANKTQLDQFELSHQGIHWDELNEDVSIAGLLAGHGDLTQTTTHAA